MHTKQPYRKPPTVWPFFLLIFGLPIVAVASGHILPTIFFGGAICIPLLLLWARPGWSSSEIATLMAGASILILIGIVFILPWGADGPQQMTVREKIMNRCQYDHFDVAYCMAK